MKHSAMRICFYVIPLALKITSEVYTPKFWKEDL